MRNEAFDALSNEHRRTLLVALYEDSPQDVAAQAAAGGDDEPSVPPQQTLIEMRHVHLPKLEEYGFVHWDRDAGVVTAGPQFGEIRPLLECVTGLADTQTIDTNPRYDIVDEEYP